MANDTRPTPTKDSGVVYIASTGNYYTTPEITYSKIIDLQDNIYAKGLAQKQLNLLFSDKYTIDVTDQNGNQDEELEIEINKMLDAKDVDLWSKIQMAKDAHFWWGCGLFNEVWDYVDNKYTLLKIRHLPEDSFGTQPDSSDGNIYSQILQGITLNKKGQIEFWQTQEESEPPVILKNVFMVKDPTTTKLAGVPVILPLIPILSMLKFVWDTQMQQANRTGAKILFIKVTDPQPANTLNGNVSDMEAAREILEHWGKNNAFPLRGNMEIIDPGIKDDSNNLEIIEALNQMLIDYISPINFITAANDSARLGGSDSQRMEMILRYIRSVHSWIENSFEQLVQKYLNVNGYEGYKIKINIPEPEIDTSEVDLKRADIGVKSKALKLNEVRMLLGHEPLEDDELAELEEYYKRNQPEPSAFGFKELTHQEDEHKPTTEEHKLTTDLEETAKELSDSVIYALRHEVEA